MDRHRPRAAVNDRIVERERGVVGAIDDDGLSD
jgi:hypothetical protein